VSDHRLLFENWKFPGDNHGTILKNSYSEINGVLLRKSYSTILHYFIDLPVHFLTNVFEFLHLVNECQTELNLLV